MIKFTRSKPLSVGVISTEYFDSYNDLEPKLEGIMERLADKGYDISELEDSTSKNGCIEVTHDNLADVLVFEWTTENN